MSTQEVPHILLSGKCELKQQLHTTTHLHEWPAIATLATPNAGEDGEPQELSFIPSERQNVKSTSKAVWQFHTKKLKTYVHAKIHYLPLKRSELPIHERQEGTLHAHY